MKSYKEFAEVVDELGEKAVTAFVTTVSGARADLKRYREEFPQWVAEHSERGLANWISDRIWARLALLIDGIPDMEMTDKGPLRELTVGLNYRLRVKRHHEDGHVASYPTQGFLEFAAQEDESQLPGMEETRLIAGYDWDKELREMGAAVLSLHDGKDNLIWKEPLPVPAENAVDDGNTGGAVAMPEKAHPTGPVIEVSDEIGQAAKEASEDA